MSFKPSLQVSFSNHLDMLLANPITNQVLMPLLFLTNMARKGFGHGAIGAGSGTGGKAKALIVTVILVLIIPFIALLFSGATTGSSGLYGNSTIGYAVRQSTYNFSQFIVLILVLGALGITLALL